jgi:Protein of unknown function (DUF1769)
VDPSHNYIFMTQTTLTVEDYILRVRAGPNHTQLITVNVNDEFTPIIIDNEHFSGYLIVRMLDFKGVTPAMDKKMEVSAEPKKGKKSKVGGQPASNAGVPISNPASSYFKGRNRRYSMMLQGCFKKQWDGDDIIFGVDLDVPIRAPIGTSVGIKIAKWLDPSIEADVDCAKPYIFAPLVSAMNSLAVYEPTADEIKKGSETTKKQAVIVASSVDSKQSVDSFESKIGQWSFHSSIIEENIGLLMSEEKDNKTSHEKRKKVFSNLAKRKSVSIRPNLVYCMDFYDAYFDFSTCSVKLPGFSLNAFKYWDGQPVRYSATTRDRSAVFFVVQFELVPRSNYGSVDAVNVSR